MFILIHSLVSGNLEQFTEENENTEVLKSSMHISTLSSSMLFKSKSSKVDITLKQFNYIYTNKILPSLNEKDKMTDKFEF